MRLSVLQHDVGYRTFANNYNAFLDGNRVSKCITADEEAGYILKYKEDENGDFVCDKSGQPLTEELTGNVVLKEKANEET